MASSPTLIGPRGKQGAAGAQGPAGPAGATGATGATGPAGPAGATGATGATGPQGDPGALAVVLGTVNGSGSFGVGTETAGTLVLPGALTGTWVLEGSMYVNKDLSSQSPDTYFSLDGIGNDISPQVEHPSPLAGDLDYFFFQDLIIVNPAAGTYRWNVNGASSGTWSLSTLRLMQLAA